MIETISYGTTRVATGKPANMGAQKGKHVAKLRITNQNAADKVSGDKLAQTFVVILNAEIPQIVALILYYPSFTLCLGDWR